MIPQTLDTPALSLVRPDASPDFAAAIPSKALPGDALYFLEMPDSASHIKDVTAPPFAAPAGALPAVPQASLPSNPEQAYPFDRSKVKSGEPGPQFDQTPTYGHNFPDEAQLRPQDLSTLHGLPPPTFPNGYNHAAEPASAGELNYFLNEANSSSSTQPSPATSAIDQKQFTDAEHLRPSDSGLQSPVSSVKSPSLFSQNLVSGTRPFDPHAIKQDFPILHQRVHGKPLIWLDNAATTQKPQAVIDRITRFYESENSNIHRGAHALAARSTDAYEAAREKTRHFLNASSTNDIVFTRGATEAINLVAQAWGRRNIHEGDEIVITWLEHHANIVPWQMLCAEKGAILRVAPVDDSGQILLDEYTKLMNPRTRMVSLPQVSNALGTVTPAQEMVAIAHRHGACVLVDGAQSVSHMPVDVQSLDCDFFVFSGHKVFAPTGIGVLYGKPEVFAAMPPWQGGGNMIADVTFEKTIYQPPPGRFEAGTGNIADAVGLGAAIDYVERIGMANISAHEHALLAYATEGLCRVPGLCIIGRAKEKAGVISFVLDGCRVEDVGKALDREGIAVRAGHHCAQPILRRFGLEATVRPSLALYNTCEDIDALVAALHRIQSQKNHHV